MTDDQTITAMATMLFRLMYVDGFVYDTARLKLVEAFPDTSGDEFRQAFHAAQDMQQSRIDQLDAITAYFGPFWSRHPDMTFEEMIRTLADRGDPRAIDWRDQMGRADSRGKPSLQ